MASFTQRVKEDIAISDAPYAIVRKKAIIAGFIRFCGYFSRRENKKMLLMPTNNAKVAKYIYQLIKEVYDADITFSYQVAQKFKKKTLFIVVVQSGVDEILDDLGLTLFDSAISRRVVYSDDTAAGFVTGAFLASGSVNDPKSINYHLEIVTSNEQLAQRLSRLIERFDRANFTPKVQKRRNKYIVYLKKSDQIGEFLIFIGAINSSLYFENIRIERDMQNVVNRMFVCDEANYAKTLKSSKEQIENIKIVQKYYGAKPEDNEKLATLMELRLEKEDATLSELADLLTEKLNSPKPISKSNVNHLFIKLRKLAEPYKEDK
ncbi:MAG TPA: DNA-binding protein WhiA [Bacilli bacterium]|nr:DNA-binding protein WhiA [Bacilli bacterium]HPK86100.1 DNA-binding protein WhiA [Bacilli bacterium]